MEKILHRKQIVAIRFDTKNDNANADETMRCDAGVCVGMRYDTFYTGGWGAGRAVRRSSSGMGERAGARENRVVTEQRRPSCLVESSWQNDSTQVAVLRRHHRPSIRNPCATIVRVRASGKETAVARGREERGGGRRAGGRTAQIIGRQAKKKKPKKEVQRRQIRGRAGQGAIRQAKIGAVRARDGVVRRRCGQILRGAAVPLREQRRRQLIGARRVLEHRAREQPVSDHAVAVCVRGLALRGPTPPLRMRLERGLRKVLLAAGEDEGEERRRTRPRSGASRDGPRGAWGRADGCRRWWCLAAGGKGKLPGLMLERRSGARGSGRRVLRVGVRGSERWSAGLGRRAVVGLGGEGVEGREPASVAVSLTDGELVRKKPNHLTTAGHMAQYGVGATERRGVGRVGCRDGDGVGCVVPALVGARWRLQLKAEGRMGPATAGGGGQGRLDLDDGGRGVSAVVVDGGLCRGHGEHGGGLLDEQHWCVQWVGEEEKGLWTDGAIALGRSDLAFGGGLGIGLCRRFHYSDVMLLPSSSIAFSAALPA
ncbi:hypothetical protein B0H14DRAFT_3132483 [Mycena olivaceomarginata]|nr:hypothetical protein B0H14DRAFT_3132483 [Mycena olivaceomarginata]